MAVPTVAADRPLVAAGSPGATVLVLMLISAYDFHHSCPREVHGQIVHV